MTFQTFTGMDYLQIDIANNFGKDKLDWDKRIEWFKQNENQLDNLVKEAENPALFFAGVQAYRKAKAGQPSGYPISLDGCSSGLQLLACLTTDRMAASLCNVVDTGHREDAYTAVYQAMTEYIGESGKITRSQCKEAIMTALYGSEAVPKRIFGEGELLQVFYGAMSLMAPHAWNLNQAFLAIWNPEAMKYFWTLPDNFHVHTKVMATVTEDFHFMDAPEQAVRKVNMPTATGRSLSANSVHSIDGYIVRELSRRCMFNPEQIMRVKTALCYFGEPELQDTEAGRMVQTLWNHYEKTGMLSARILDYLDEDTVGLLSDRQPIWELIYSLPRKPFQVLSIHDCVRVLPHYGNDVRRQYNNLLAEVAKGNLLNTLLSEITGREINIPKVDPDMWKDVKVTNYALS